MRKYLLPSVICLLIGLSAAWAQTFTRAIQLSQDTTGAFSVDTNNGVYFPGHILTSSSGVVRRAPSIAGTGTPTLTGTDTAGTITMGTNGQTAQVTFGQSFVSVPNCVVTWQTVPNGTAIQYSATTAILNVTQPAGTGNKINYWCSSIS